MASECTGEGLKGPWEEGVVGPWGEKIWEWVGVQASVVRFFFSLLRDRCKLKKRKAQPTRLSLSGGVVKLTGRPARRMRRHRREYNVGEKGHMFISNVFVAIQVD